MKILLTSDIHGNKEIIEKILLENQNCDYFFDAGDSQLNPNELSPIITVKGNCDYNNDLLNSILFTTPLGKLYIQHSPNIPYHILQNQDIKIIINGHTHIPKHQVIENTHFINPGSVTYPRSSNVGTYMILEISKEDIKVILKDVLF